jgi:hypothetical protein
MLLKKAEQYQCLSFEKVMFVATLSILSPQFAGYNTRPHRSSDLSAVIGSPVRGRNVAGRDNVLCRLDQSLLCMTACRLDLEAGPRRPAGDSGMNDNMTTIVRSRYMPRDPDCQLRYR